MIDNSNTETTTEKKKVRGCNCSGGCSSGGCNRLNTFDWLSALEIQDVSPCDLAEVSFKNGVSKEFYKLNPRFIVEPGDMVAVETDAGWDVGRVNLVGELVRLQLKKKRKKETERFPHIVRIATDGDIEKMNEVRRMERNALIRARAIARTLNLDMKISDVQFQADRRKARFYFIADNRVDFRELIKLYAREFHVKVEMKQIGSRQESALVGGIGSCGRELCCSTWLTDFKSVNTSAARYQNLAINQAKLSGQCGRLKCCLNYELDNYIDALKEYPDNVNSIKTQKHKAYFVKTDIFKRVMYYTYQDEFGRNIMLQLPPERVREIAEENKEGNLPFDFVSPNLAIDVGPKEPSELDFEENLTGVIELPKEKRTRKPKRRKGKNRPNRSNKSAEQEQSRSKKRTSDKNKNSEQGENKSKSKRRGRGPRNSKREKNSSNQNNTNQKKDN